VFDRAWGPRRRKEMEKGTLKRRVGRGQSVICCPQRGTKGFFREEKRCQKKWGAGRINMAQQDRRWAMGGGSTGEGPAQRVQAEGNNRERCEKGE